jgi:hypothetical protein
MPVIIRATYVTIVTANQWREYSPFLESSSCAHPHSIYHGIVLKCYGYSTIVSYSQVASQVYNIAIIKAITRYEIMLSWR